MQQDTINANPAVAVLAHGRLFDFAFYNKRLGIFGFYFFQKAVGFELCAEVAHAHFKVGSVIRNVCVGFGGVFAQELRFYGFGFVLICAVMDLHSPAFHFAVGIYFGVFAYGGFKARVGVYVALETVGCGRSLCTQNERTKQKQKKEGEANHLMQNYESLIKVEFFFFDKCKVCAVIFGLRKDQNTVNEGLPFSSDFNTYLESL
jgi:hypothetical protein